MTSPDFPACKNPPRPIGNQSKSTTPPKGSRLAGKTLGACGWRAGVSVAHNKTKSYLIEVKPKKQTKPPVKPKRQTKGYIREAYEYAKNQSKWEAATEYCLDRGWSLK